MAQFAGPRRGERGSAGQIVAGGGQDSLGPLFEVFAALVRGVGVRGFAVSPGQADPVSQIAGFAGEV